MNIADTKRSEKDVRFELTKNMEGKNYPIIESASIRTVERGNVLFSEGLGINGYLNVTLKFR
ncbi:hypothetical protein LAV72_05280 [Lysinibacillus xylanilyticus]|uniref:hypothetical protein n=1 Tax=Lysinibacillus xylanilyticus TaxID=582475 RepID=UPI002B25046A|nr:hypothetical protein [Lysinibacillus xylanilyticus]MEB2299034.1 hypothetical protein [Lysinibacillus xylanilyticus]